MCSISTLQSQTMGLFYNTPDSYQGYTLMTNNETTYLIDNCGYIVNTWVSEYKSGGGLELTPQGHLVRAAKDGGIFNAGGAYAKIEIFNWDGVVIWEYTLADNAMQAHHDIELLPNGNILCLVWQWKSEQECQNHGCIYSGELWSESIIELKPINANQAEIIWQWNLWDHLIQDQNNSLQNFGSIVDNPHRMDINARGQGEDTSGDWLHLNSIDYNAITDQIAVSSRHLSEVYIIDHSTTTSQASGSSGGQFGKGGDFLFRFGNPSMHQANDNQLLFKPHDVNWVDATTLSIFNNDYSIAKSAVQYYTLPVEANGEYLQTVASSLPLAWQYDEAGFYSSILSSAQVLPNDNILILEGKKGKITEVMPNKEKVWEYIFPVNVNGGPGIQGGTPQFNTLFKTQRYSTQFEGFEGKNLEPTVPIELSPDEYDCETYTSLLPSPIETLDWKIYPNPTTLAPNIINVPLGYKIFYSSLDGNMKIYSEGQFENSPSGIYFFQLRDIHGRTVSAKKVVKVE